MAGFPQGPPEQIRRSHGLEQFFASLREPAGQTVLDLGEFTQSNVVHLTNMGHRLYSEDLQRALQAIFGPGEAEVTQADPEKARLFLDQVLQFPPEQFDALLIWDCLEHLTRPLLDVVMRRIYEILRPGATVMACFHADTRQEFQPHYSYRIVDSATMQLVPKGPRRQAQSFNNRAIEKLFDGFHSVKFFLTRDNLREVIVRR
jgi:cyclopropane fatty-acyl-phospholipid synthase-like methyltransferase